MDNILNPITAYRKERNWSLSDSAAHAAGEHHGGAKRIAPVLTPYKKRHPNGCLFLVETTELESVTSTMSTWRSNQLSYNPILTTDDVKHQQRK